MRTNPFQLFMEDPTRSVPTTVAKIEKNYNAPIQSLREIFANDTDEVNLKGRIDYQLLMDESKLGLPRMQTRSASSAETMRVRKKSGIYLEVPHYKKNGAIRADDFLGKVEDNASERLVIDTIESEIAQRFTNSWDDFTLLDEYNYASAIQGLVRDGLDDTKINIYDKLGLTQKVFEWNFTSDYNPTPDARKAIAYQKKALAGTVTNRRIGVCSGDFWDALVTNKFLIDTYKYTDSKFLRSLNLEGMSFLDIDWLQYDNDTVDNNGNITKWIPEGTAFIVPVGIPDLFINVNAPADTMPEVLGKAKHRYSNYWMSDDRRNLELEAQTNTMTFCTRIESIVKLTIKNHSPSAATGTFTPPVAAETRRR